MQGEIDKMLEENPDAEWSDIVKEAKEDKKNRKNKTKKLCECCGENEIDEDEQYCEDCLNVMKHYPFVWWKYLIPVFAVVLVFLALSYFAISFSVFQGTVSANKLIKAGKLNSALNAYDKINAEIKVTDENFGSRYLKYQVGLYETLGVDQYDNALKFIEKYYDGTKIDKRSNKDVKAFRDDIKSYEKLYEKFTTAYSAADDYKTFVEVFDELTKLADYNPAHIYYYKYYAANVMGEDISVMRENVEKIKEVSPESKTLYLPLLAEISLNEGKYDDMVKYADELKSVNAESPYVYLYQAVAYRFKGDLAKAAKALNDGLKTSPANSLLNYQMGIVCLLQGKQKEAFSFAATAYEQADTANAYVSAASLYSLCAQLIGETEVNESIIAEVEQYGYPISDDVQKVIDGELTVEKLFTEGKRDFSWNS
ncbi:MAG: hypothetical protein J5782_04925 [Clostridia bacterium]|nr:hypothetical protein [Clostridia bacterium]